MKNRIQGPENFDFVSDICLPKKLIIQMSGTAGSSICGTYYQRFAVSSKITPFKESRSGVRVDPVVAYIDLVSLP
jgi:hypothetical protein